MRETVVLLVEDDRNLMRANRRILERAGYTALCAETLAEARLCMQKAPPDLIVLDIMLPDGSGLDFCKEIADETVAPILFLTARDKKDEVLEGLRAGGNDYITKPFDMEVLLARIEAQLRHVSRVEKSAGAAHTVSLGPLTMDILSARALLEGADMLLSTKEFALLLLLAQHEGETLSKETLYERVWKAPPNDDARVLWSHLSRLRKKLEGTPFHITQVRGEGYRMEYRPPSL